MRRCSVPGCRSNFTKPYVSVFSFPKDQNITKKWLKSIGCPNLKVHENIGVCIKHFEKHFICGTGNSDRKKVTLKHGSVPTIVGDATSSAEGSVMQSPDKSSPFSKVKKDKRQSGSMPKKRRFNGNQYTILEVKRSSASAFSKVKKDKRQSGSRPKKRRFNGNQYTILEVKRSSASGPRKISKSPKSDSSGSRTPSQMSSEAKSPGKAQRKISPTTFWPIITTITSGDGAEDSQKSNDDDDCVIEEPKSSSNEFTSPSPYRNLPSVSVCLKDEDRISFTRELKGIKRSPSLNSNSSTGSSEQTVTSVKRRKIEKVAPTVLGRDNDCYCWVCHRENVVLNCIACPRAYHSRCAGESLSYSQDWVCPVCETILAAENVDTRSSTLTEISLEKLNALLKLSFNRFKARAPIQFHSPVPTAAYPLYLHYVIHPMDLSVIERNLKQNAYGCTEAFLADVKWMAHNSCVFNGSQHSLSTYAKNMVKACDHDMQEIEICPDCFVHSVVRNKYWFSEVCRKPHPIVWAKLKGFPYWPAKVVRIMDGNVDARFFGAHDRAWVPSSQCYHLSKEMPTSSKPKKKSNYEVALDELNVHVHLIIEKFKCFEYAPYRTPFDPENKHLMYHGIDIDKAGKEEISIDTNASPSRARFPSPEKENRFTNIIESESEKMESEKNDESLPEVLTKKSELDENNSVSCLFKERPPNPATEKVLKPIENAREISMKEISSSETKKDSSTTVSKPGTEPLSDSDQLRKLELALERIKGYVSLNAESEKEEEKGSEVDGEKEEKKGEAEAMKGVPKGDETNKDSIHKSVSDNEKSDTQPLMLFKSAFTFPVIEKAESAVADESINTSLEATKKTDSFFLKLNETIQSCKAKLGISEITDDISDDESNNEADDDESSEADENSESGEEVIDDGAENEDSDEAEGSEEDVENGVKDGESSEAEESAGSDYECDEASSSENSGTDVEAENSKANHTEGIEMGAKNADSLQGESNDNSALNTKVQKPSVPSVIENGGNSNDVITQEGETEKNVSMEVVAELIVEKPESESKSPPKNVQSTDKLDDNSIIEIDCDKDAEVNSTLNNTLSTSELDKNKDCHPNVAKSPHTKEDLLCERVFTDTTKSANGHEETLDKPRDTESQGSNINKAGEVNNIDDFDDDIIPCNSPPPRPKTPPIIVLDDDLDESSVPDTDACTAAASTQPVNNSDQISRMEIVNSYVCEERNGNMERSSDAKRKLNFDNSDIENDDIQILSPERQRLTGAIRTFKRKTSHFKLRAPKQEVLDDSTVEKDSNVLNEAQAASVDSVRNLESDTSSDSNLTPRNVIKSPVDLRNLSEKDKEIFILKSKLNSVVKAYHIHSWKWTQEREELRHNMNLIIMEMRASFEADKKQAVETLCQKYEQEKLRLVEESKRKQWCATCLMESRYACCWNTSYCSIDCQKKHFIEHRKVCTQVKKSQEATEIKQVSSLKSSDSTETKKLIVVNMKQSDNSKAIVDVPTCVSSQQLTVKQPQFQVVAAPSKNPLQLSSQASASPTPFHFLLAPIKPSSDNKPTTLVSSTNSVKSGMLITTPTSILPKLLPPSSTSTTVSPVSTSSLKPVTTTTSSAVSAICKVLTTTVSSLPTAVVSSPAQSSTPAEDKKDAVVPSGKVKHLKIFTFIQTDGTTEIQGENDFQEVLNLIRKILLLSSGKFSELISKLKELGVQRKDDLKYILSEDFNGILSSIEFRKLVSAVNLAEPPVVSETKEAIVPQNKIITCLTQNRVWAKKVLKKDSTSTPSIVNPRRQVIKLRKAPDISKNVVVLYKNIKEAHQSFMHVQKTSENSETSKSTLILDTNLSNISPTVNVPTLVISSSSVLPSVNIVTNSLCQPVTTTSKTSSDSDSKNQEPPQLEPVSCSSNSSLKLNLTNDSVQDCATGLGESTTLVAKTQTPPILKNILDSDTLSTTTTADVEPLPTDPASNSQTVKPNYPPVLSPTNLNKSDLEAENAQSSDSHSEKLSWAKNFEVPWTKLPKEIQEVLEKNLIPSRVQMIEIIKQVSQKIYSITTKPDHKSLKIIVNTMISKYPKAFQDTCKDADGSGTMILKRIKYWIQNRNKKINLGKIPPDVLAASKNVPDKYGCTNWHPPLIFGETEATQEKHKNYLKEEYKKLNRCHSEIKRKMMLTFSSQRHYINFKSRNIKDVQQEWPFLFEEEYLLKHFNRLVGNNVSQTLQVNLQSKGHILFKYFSSMKAKSDKMKICFDKVKLFGLKKKILSVIPLLLAYFKENDETLLQQHEDFLSSEEIELSETIPTTPFIATVGGSLYTASNFALVIDKTVVSHFMDAMTAITALFASFYVFNIEYPSDCANTLEYIQRNFANINPTAKTKTSVQGQLSKAYNISPKILMLNEKLASYKQVNS